MRCDDRRDLILFHAADVLEPAERQELEAHLATGCPRCAGLLAEARATLAQLPLALEPSAAPIRVRERLLTRVAADAGPGREPVPSVRPGRRRIPVWLQLTGAAAVAATVTLVVAVLPMQRRLQLLQAEQERLLARLEAQSVELARVQTSLQHATDRVRVLVSPQLEVFALAGGEPQPEARGRIFWDRSRKVWHLYTANMRPAGPGRTYELWFITADDRKVPAGTFDVDASGEGTLVAPIPEGLGSIVLAAITDEPSGGVAQPTGSIQVVGRPGSPS